MNNVEQFNQEEFDRFRSDPRRIALVERILETEAATGHVIGATYRSKYWGGTYRVVASAGDGVLVECVTPGGGAHQTVGEQWTHSTMLDRKDQRVDYVWRPRGMWSARGLDTRVRSSHVSRK